MSTPTPEGPASPEPQKKPATPAQIAGGLVVIGIILVCVIAVVVNMGDEPGDEDVTAEIMCEDFIERDLVSPASAEYTHESTTFDDPYYTVVGYVDSENALGATLRSEYTCVVEPTGDDQWRLESLDLSER